MESHVEIEVKMSQLKHNLQQAVGMMDLAMAALKKTTHRSKAEKMHKNNWHTYFKDLLKAYHAFPDRDLIPSLLRKKAKELFYTGSVMENKLFATLVFTNLSQDERILNQSFFNQWYCVEVNTVTQLSSTHFMHERLKISATSGLEHYTIVEDRTDYTEQGAIKTPTFRMENKRVGSSIQTSVQVLQTEPAPQPVPTRSRSCY